MRIRLAVACALMLFAADSAQARREQTFRYPFARVWSATLRMMRVDYESPITEKDIESGYFLFTYPQDGKENPGSAELVRTMEAGVESVRVVIQVPALPTYVEQMMLDRLRRKLAQEFGDPTPGKKPKPEEGEEPPPGEKPPGAQPPGAQPPAPPAAPKQPPAP
jgi:hypothetical protein